MSAMPALLSSSRLPLLSVVSFVCKPALLAASATLHPVSAPKVEPKLPVSFWGFTENAEVWNSRASLIGLFGIVIVEAIIHKGLLQVISVEVGQGLELPL